MARLRRRLPAKQVAERAGMSAMTLRGVERGGPGVTIGAYLAVLQVLGMDEDLDLLAKDDSRGAALQDASLTGRPRASRNVVAAVPRDEVQGPLPIPVPKTANSDSRVDGIVTAGKPRSSATKGTAEKESPGFVTSDELAKLIRPGSPTKKKR